MTDTRHGTSERDQKIAELDKAFADAANLPFHYEARRFPSVSHILGSDWGSSLLPRGPDNAEHYREAAYRFVDLHWPPQCTTSEPSDE